MFHARLREFWESHPEGDEIPGGVLPEPFNRPKKVNILDTSETGLPTKLSLCMRYNDIVNNVESSSIDEKMSAPVETSIELLNEHLAAASHIAPLFRARFSLKFKQNLVDTVHQISQVDSVQLSPVESASQAASSENYSTICASLESSSAPAPTSTPSKTVNYTENEVASCLKRIDAMSTPAKLASSSIRLISATPALRSPKRYLMSPDDHPTSSSRRPSRSRSLRFDSPVKNEEVVNEDNAGGLPIDDVFDILPGKLIQSPLGTSNNLQEDSLLALNDDFLIPEDHHYSLSQKQQTGHVMMLIDWDNAKQ
ncbi:hypothetical protein V8G54_007294 [Vigna mungo]|uniref:Uncharacterized protein n=1 Tax=Vigna mungo TaxID=3915 RepID=A0AAQ3P3R1_VIGMU